MLDEKLIRKKSRRKRDRLTGVSLVHFVCRNTTLDNEIEGLFKLLGKHSRCFVRTKQSSLHVTLIRCESVEEIAENPEVLSRELAKTSIRFCKHCFNSLGFYLTADGIIRLQLSEVPKAYYENVEVGKSYTINCMNYKIIEAPWITVAYTDERYISSLIACEQEIRNIIDNYVTYTRVEIENLQSVMYSDTAFNEYQIMHSWGIPYNEE